MTDLGTPASSRPARLETLQIGRGIAAVSVAAFHLSILLGLPRYLGHAVFFAFTRRGNLGVDFFFVLSSFVIVSAHADDIGQPTRVISYLKKRFGRLFPIYWIHTTIFCVLIALGIGSHSSMPHSVQNWLATIFLIRLDQFEMPITPAWSLVHELAFYLVFAVMIINRWGGAAVLALWLVLGLFVFQYGEEGTRQPWSTYLSPLNINFLVGMLACYAWRRVDASYLKFAFPLGLVALLAVYTAESGGLPYPWTQIPYALAFGFMIAGAAAWESDGNLTRKYSVLGLIGDASYSIYLTHLAFLGIFAKLFIKILGADGPYSGPAVYAAALVTTIASGCLLYWILERPLLRAYRVWSGARLA